MGYLTQDDIFQFHPFAYEFHKVIVFDSSSTDFNELKKFVRIALSGTSFDRRKDYYLIVKDKASEVELQRNKVIRDIGFIE